MEPTKTAARNSDGRTIVEMKIKQQVLAVQRIQNSVDVVYQRIANVSSQFT